ncbi:uncharacterized protein DUF488 [Arcicella aurantiaca]|uniref:Uncharacterized protein DUF488 n=1 Tax=Arcicella aurantiaca TaxID=591202 RepID=A0A316DUX0_9BACT|nr:DUF488 domain-containing protein [Arcicella aurantiaca]PWK21881.1 uncharacterized protein DUF488 [Arcicella aurantiaca]
MMYYRRKILLSIFEAFGGQLSKISLQKLLLLFTKYQEKPAYEFVPHRFGCFSFQANWDLQALKTYGKIKDTAKGWELTNETFFRNELTVEDKNRVSHLFRTYENFSADELMRETYIKFPYYAIRSEKASEILNSAELSRVLKQKPIKEKTALFTLGYEGITIEKYFNKLLLNDVKVLCDVRRNPLSQKVGFSKNQLKSVCDALDITYIHIPQLGIPSEKRQSLNSQKDYDALFLDYEANYLINQSESVSAIFDILEKNKRIALTCFEASFCQCHRSKVAKAITKLENWKYELIHL